MKRLFSIILAVVLTFTLSPATLADGGIDAGTNAYRQTNGLSALGTSPALSTLAFQRAQQIVCESPDTCDNFHHDYWWTDHIGCWTGVGENLTYRIPSPDGDISAYAVQQWINSAPHRANMLGDFTHQGSAIVYSDGGYFAVQLFQKVCTTAPAPTPAPYVPPASEAPVVMLPDTAISYEEER